MSKRFVLPDSIAKYHNLWLEELRVFQSVSIEARLSSLSIRGITLNFDGKDIQIGIYFDSTPTEKEIEAMKTVKTKFNSSQQYLCVLAWEVVSAEESLSDRTKNWGWVYLRPKETDTLTERMLEYGTISTYGKYHDLWVSEMFGMGRYLLGEITKAMRGVTLNFDGKVIQIIVYFDCTPTEKEIEAMEEIETLLISGHEYMSDLVLEVIPVTESLVDKVKNWGWVYLRRED